MNDPKSSENQSPIAVRDLYHVNRISIAELTSPPIERELIQFLKDFIAWHDGGDVVTVERANELLAKIKPE